MGAVVGDGLAVGARKSRQTVTRVAALAAVAARCAVATRLVVGAEVEISTQANKEQRALYCANLHGCPERSKPLPNYR